MPLTKNKVEKIRHFLNKGLGCKVLARKFEVHHSTIEDIRKGLTWNPKRKKLAKEIQKISVRGENNHWSKLTEKEVKHIRKLLDKGIYSQAAIAKAYGVTSQLISLINLKKIWIHL